MCQTSVVVDKTADWLGATQEQRRNASPGTARDIRKTTPLAAIDELADSLEEVAQSIKQQVADAKMSALAPAAPPSPSSASGAAASSQPVVRATAPVRAAPDPGQPRYQLFFSASRIAMEKARPCVASKERSAQATKMRKLEEEKTTFQQQLEKASEQVDQLEAESRYPVSEKPESARCSAKKARAEWERAEKRRREPLIKLHDKRQGLGRKMLTRASAIAKCKEAIDEVDAGYEKAAQLGSQALKEAFASSVAPPVAQDVESPSPMVIDPSSTTAMPSTPSLTPMEIDGAPTSSSALQQSALQLARIVAKTKCASKSQAQRRHSTAMSEPLGALHARAPASNGPSRHHPAGGIHG